MADNLYDLFAELRALKQIELPRKLPDPIEQARHDLSVAVEIERVEKEIEEEMSQ